MKRNRGVPVLVQLMLIVATALAGCTGGRGSVDQPSAGGQAVSPASPDSIITPASAGPSAVQPAPGKGVPVILNSTGTPDSGLQLRLSEGAASAAAPITATLAASSPLPIGELQAILNRLPAFQAAVTQTVDFARPAASLPAPRPGKTVTDTFPPPPGLVTAATAPTGGAVTVLRHAPDGEVPLAPYLSATFSQPMVALTGIQDLAAGQSPIQFQPQVPGKWRWVGTQTLLFEPDGPVTGGGPGRFPMATYYTATVPAGTVAVGGSKLAEALQWTFSTPPIQLQSSLPNGGPQRRDAVMFAAFDQRIDPQALVKLIQAKAGGKTYPVRLATDEEIKADPATKGLAERGETGRWLAFRSDEPFPADSDVTVTFPPGTPSAEGPRRTDKAQSFSFHTYGPLRVTESRCGWNNTCPPTSPWYINFSNPLDSNAWQDAWVKVSPEVSGLKISQSGNSLMLQGLTQGRTKYRVTLSAAIKDVFGQTLGADTQFTFDVGSAEPTLVPTGRTMVVLDPTAKPAFSVYSININRLKVLVQAVQPEDWPAWQTYLQNYYRQGNPPSLPGKLVINKTVNVESKTDQLTETAVDLSPALTNGFGQVAIVIEPDPQPDPKRSRQVVMSWVQVTKIGLDALADGEHLVAWANALTDGAPLAGVELVLSPSPAVAPARTGADGLATLDLPTSSGAAFLVARQGQDTAILPENEYFYGGGDTGWRVRLRQDTLRWYVFDDRGIYRPGEEVHLKGWIRRIGAGKRGDVGLPGEAVRLVRYQLIDPRGNQIGTGQVEPNALGAFNLTVSISKESNLGQASLRFMADGAGSVDGRDYAHGFQVQEFRRPEFEVKASTDAGPVFVGGHALATVNANYYAGGGLPNAEVTWRVRSEPGTYTPPNWIEFTFGRWVPWWGHFGPARPVPPGGGNVQTFAGHTDGSGAHYLRLDFDSVNPPQPTTVTAEATVMDVNRQAWTASTSLLVHPASLYVGLRTARMFVEREQPLPVDVIVVDLDGVPVPGVTVKLRAARLDYTYKSGTWQQVEAAVQPCTVTSTKDPVTCKFETPQGGTYRITATITDSQGRTNLTEITRWVSGGGRPPSRNVEQEEVTLVPDRKEYKAGETAEILVQAPFTPAEGLVTLEREGIVSSQRFTMTGPSYTLKIPVEEGYIPAIDVAVDLVGSAARLTDAGQVDNRLPKRPAYARGSLTLSVPPLARTLAVTATPRDKALDPGGKTTVDLVVKDAAGQPVKDAEVAVVVVDEAVLALTNFKLDDPLGIFYTPRSPSVNDYHLRRSVTLVNPATLAGQAQTIEKAAVGAAAAAPMAAPAAAPTMAAAAPGARALSDNAASQAAPPIALRSDFSALASFTPSVNTDVQGNASVEVKLPDNLTRYRVMAVAAAGGKQFGMGESAITGRLPLMVRPSPPRFLNFGDRFELPIVLQNQTDRPMTVTVALRAANATLIRPNLERASTAGYAVGIPANDRVEVRFPATTVKPGTASFQVGASAPAANAGQTGPADAAEFSLPVWTPATTEAFATYGTIDDGSIAQPVIAPSNVYTQFGGLEITTSSTALQALSDAVLYLTSYPYECSEQLASRVLAVAALRDVLTAFHAEGLPSPEALQQAVTRDITRLRGLQNGDGGWPVWQRGDESWPYYSIHVSHALARAKAKGFDVPQDTIDRAKQYLATIEQHIPSWYGEIARRSLIAYSLYVRKQLGNADTAKARQLVDSGLQNVSKSGPANLSPEAVGWLLFVLSGDPGSQTQVAALRQYLNNRVVETAGAANFVTDYGDDNYLLLASDRRADAVILEAMIQDQPQSDLIPKIVTGLLAQRKAGRWSNTQENTFVLLALDRYFNTYEAQTPDFVARLWLGDAYAGDHTFKGRTTERSQIDVPMAYLAGAGGATQNLILSKDGPGRLYYRLGLRYAPTDLNLKPYDAGFTVERAYEAVDNPTDVRQDKDGTWHIKAGATVRVRLTMVAHDRRYHVALTDPLPAGLEALNPALAVNAPQPPAPGPVPLARPAVSPARPGAAGGVVSSGPMVSPGLVGGAVAPLSASRPIWSWWRWWTWYEHQNLRDDRAEAFTSLLWQGVYTYTYTARATTLGTFVVPPAKAEEMYAPETFGRSGTDRVVVE